MPNPGGANQLGGARLQPQYGDVRKQTQLTRSAPMSGAPLAAHALETPRRGRRHAQGQDRPAGAPGAAQPQPQQQGQPSGGPPRPEASQALTWQEIAAIPGASPLVQQLAMEAQSAG